MLEILLILPPCLGNNTNENWARAQSDLSGAMANQQILVQSIIYPAYDDGNSTAQNGLINVTGDGILGTIELPSTYPNGSSVYLGDPGPGYPPSLYPNLTYSGLPNQTNYSVRTDGWLLNPRSVLVLGPLIIDQNTALLSATTAIANNSNFADILGWLTVVINATMLFNVRDSEEGLGKTGEVLLIGPASANNKFPFDVRDGSDTPVLDRSMVRFILPPSANATIQQRHSERADADDSSIPFLASSFPALVSAWTQDTNDVNNAGAALDTYNEQGNRVAVGWAQIKTRLVDWVLVVEQAHDETVQPINHLRDIVLICVFSVVGGMLVLTFPLAHYSVAPIRQLRAATRKTVEPYQPDDSSTYSVSTAADHDSDGHSENEKKEGFIDSITKWATNASPPRPKTRSSGLRRSFRIPSKVPERRHLVHDELTDLTSKFNEMSDELLMQYERLEERVKERTAELEQAKQVAEDANQSKTLFIANISHELKTPLNGILGLTQICMNEDEPAKIKSTLNTIYKSGDLLLHLLTDLLTFSKNEVGQQLSIDEAEFKLSDLSTQLLPTFDKQAREGQIDLKIYYEGTINSFGDSNATEDKEFGPEGTGPIRDMVLWGDKNRILQVLMNFTSNSLKFTPPNGSVTIRIRCLGIADPETLKRNTSSVRKSSLVSRGSKTSSRKRVRTSDTSLTGGSDSENEKAGMRPHKGISGSDSEDGRKSILKKRPRDTKLSINTGAGKTQIDRIVSRQRSRSPPPLLNAKILEFQFEVEDTGPGIPEEQQGKIFEPFVQGDLGLSKKYGGTGLGLSICAQLADLMGGELFIDSTVGKGSKFGMALPLHYITQRPGSISVDGPLIPAPSAVETAGLQNCSASPKQVADSAAGHGEVPRVIGLTQPYMTTEVRPAPPHTVSSELKLMRKAETEAAKQGSKVKVLVAEDNKINQEVVLRMLKLEDVYDVTIAKDGQEAYDRVRESMENGERYHLIFMDVQMPNVDGIQSTKMIRGMGFDAPIVALTAFAEKSNEDECMASGMDAFLAKPIKRPQLKKVLTRFCAPIPEEEDTHHESISTKIPSNSGQLDGQAGAAVAKAESAGSDRSAQPTPESSVSAEEEHDTQNRNGHGSSTQHLISGS